MVITRSKLVALVIASGYVFTLAAISGWDTAGGASIFLLFPLGFIWFPEEIEELTCIINAGRRYRIYNVEVPASIVTLLGWLGLLGYVPFLVYLLSP
jgi:hypothetical protein